MKPDLVLSGAPDGERPPPRLATTGRALPSGEAAWNLTGLYPGLDSDAFRRDLRTAYERIKSIRTLVAQLEAAIPGYREGRVPYGQLAVLCIQSDTLQYEVEELLADLHVYCTARVSTSSDDASALVMLRKISALAAELSLSVQSLDGVFSALTDADFGLFLITVTNPGAALRRGGVREERRETGEIPEERTIAILGSEAFRAWADLYQRLAAELVVTVTTEDGVVEELGIAEATALLLETDAGRRRSAWEAIRRAWEPHETTVAAILNNLASYRLKLQQIRRKDGNADFLSPSLAENRLSSAALDRLMDTIEARRPKLHRAVHLMATLLGKDRVDPWDLAASCVEREADEVHIPLDDALALIQAAFAEVDPSMGNFVSLMYRQGWIDARPHAKGRRLGAYQTSVRRGRYPLVFTNYRGRRLDVITLAHELGHAYHYWLLRDEAPEYHRLPVTLAECASSFAEMLVRERWYASNPADSVNRRHWAWAECQTITSFLLNTPASFTFERQLYVERRKGPLTVPRLRQSLEESWTHWFGTTLTSYDDRGWVRKPHFASTRLFYNYPYIFGFLIAVLMRNSQKQLGSEFFPFFRTFLQDSARLTVDELLSRHFGKASDSAEFWDNALDLVDQRIKRAASLTGRNYTTDI